MKKTFSDKERIRFLKLAYFGIIDDPYYVAGDRAYRDFCRTIDFVKSEHKITRKEYLEQAVERQDCKNNIYRWIEQELKQPNIEYDNWHEHICEGIINQFMPQASLKYGQAQKWLNMMMKYLLVLGVDEAENQIPYLHIPIDRSVLKKAKDLYNIAIPQSPWSQWNKEEYIKYQQLLKDMVSPHFYPILWEFEMWEPYVTIEEQ